MKSFYFRPFCGVGHAHYMIIAELGEGGSGKLSSSIFSLEVWFKKKKGITSFLQGFFVLVERPRVEA